MAAKKKIETYVPPTTKVDKKDKKEVIRSVEDYLCKTCFCYGPDEDHASYGRCHRHSVTIDKSENDWCFEYVNKVI